MPQVSARLLLLVLCELVPAVICSGFGQTEGGDLQLQDSAHDDAFSQSAVRAQWLVLVKEDVPAVRDCFRGKRVVMVGDSMMRYQYLALVYWLENGVQPPPGFHAGEGRGGWDKFSVCNEFSWDVKDGEIGKNSSWTNFYSETARGLNGHESCDCWRNNGFDMVENRYYRCVCRQLCLYLSTVDGPALRRTAGWKPTTSQLHFSSSPGLHRERS